MNVRTSGFTILEMLVAVVVLFLLTTLIFSFIRHSSTASTSLAAQNTFQSVCAKLTDQLRQDLGSASEVTITSHGIDLQRYTTWSSGTGLSTERIIYSADESGLLVDRAGKVSRHDLDSVRKAIVGTLEFNTVIKHMPASSTSDMAVVEIAIRIVPNHRAPIPGFTHLISINTSARVKATAVPEPNENLK